MTSFVRINHSAAVNGGRCSEQTRQDYLLLSLSGNLAVFENDYLIGDKYFKVKRAKHNLIRTRCQVALAKDMQTKLDAMDAIVNSCVKKYR